MAIETASKVGTCCSIVVLIDALAAAEAIRSGIRPMAASSGFRLSPGHAALGDALRIALARRHGH